MLYRAGGACGVARGLGRAVVSRRPGGFRSPAETRTVVDSAGRTVELPDEPQRIAAMDPFAGEVCVLSGAGERLFGAPGGVKSNVLLAQLAPGLPDVVQLSGSSVNVETLMSGGVDAVFVKESLYESAGELDKLDRLGIPYVVVGYETVDEQMDAIRLVGEACGGDAASRAGAIADYYRETAELVERRAAEIPDDGRVRVYHSINDPLLCDGAGSLGADWIGRAGAVDVSAGEPATGGNGDFTATLEQVYAWEPDAIVCSTADARAAIAGDAQWSGLSAVAAGRVFNLPVSASRWGQRGDPETFLGMLWLGKTLYPQLYEDIDLRETVTAYYRNVVGLEVDDGMWDQIVSGEGIRAQGTGNGPAS